MTITKSDVYKFCENRDYEVISKLISDENKTIREIYCRNYYDDNFYNDKKIFWIFFDNYSKFLNNFDITDIFINACKKFDVDVVKKMYELFPQVEYYCYDYSIDCEIIECMNIDISEFIMDKFRFCNREKTITKIILYAIKFNKIEIIKYYDKYLSMVDPIEIITYCHNHGNYEFILSFFKFYDIQNIEFNVSKLSCPKDTKIIDYFINEYPEFMNVVMDIKYLHECLVENNKIATYIIENYDINIFSDDNYIFKKIFNYELDSVKYLMYNYPDIDYNNLDYIIHKTNFDNILYIVGKISNIGKVWNRLGNCYIHYLIVEYYDDINKMNIIDMFHEYIDWNQIFYSLNLDEMKYVEEKYGDIIFTNEIEISKLINYGDYEYIKFLLSQYDNIYYDIAGINTSQNLDDFRNMITFIDTYFSNSEILNFIYYIWIDHDNYVIDKFDFLISSGFYEIINTSKLLNNVCYYSNFETLNIFIQKYSYLFQNISHNEILENSFFNKKYDLFYEYVKNNFDDIIIKHHEYINKYLYHDITNYQINKILKLCNKNNFIPDIDPDKIKFNNMKIFIDYFDDNDIDYDLDKIFNNVCAKNNSTIINLCVNKYRQLDKCIPDNIPDWLSNSIKIDNN